MVYVDVLANSSTQAMQGLATLTLLGGRAVSGKRLARRRFSVPTLATH
jgi:hypothetical protein